MFLRDAGCGRDRLLLDTSLPKSLLEPRLTWMLGLVRLGHVVDSSVTVSVSQEGKLQDAYMRNSAYPSGLGSFVEAAARCGVRAIVLKEWMLENAKAGPTRWSAWMSGAEKIPEKYLILFLRARMEGSTTGGVSPPLESQESPPKRVTKLPGRRRGRA